MPGATLAAMKPCSEGAEKSVISARRMRPGAPFATSTAPATSILPWWLRPPPPATGSSLVRKGISVSSTSSRPASGRAARRDHGPAKFGAQEPRRLVGAEAELVAELQCRNGVGMRGHEIGRPEPGRQRQLRTVHNGTRGDRGLLAAGGTLEGEGLSAMRPSLLMGAGRTAEARPTRGEQPSRAGGFIRVASLKVAERNREVGHDGASEAAMFALRSYQPTPRLSLHWSARTQRDKPSALNTSRNSFNN